MAYNANDKVKEIYLYQYVLRRKCCVKYEIYVRNGRQRL